MTNLVLRIKYGIEVDGIAKIIYIIGFITAIFQFVYSEGYERALWFIGFWALDAAAGIYLLMKWVETYVNLKLMEKEENNQ